MQKIQSENNFEKEEHNWRTNTFQFQKLTTNHTVIKTVDTHIKVEL